MRRGEDEWITVGVNGYAIEDPTRRKAGRRLIIGFVSDVSERIRAEAERQALAAQLRQAEKMEAVGRLAGGIAHDFNNILGAILGYGELAQAKVESDPQLKRYVDTIVNAGERGKALVAQILAYSRAESGTLEPVILGSVADGGLRAAARLVVGGHRGAPRGAARGAGGAGRPHAPAPARHEPRLQRAPRDAGGRGARDRPGAAHAGRARSTRACRKCPPANGPSSR